MGFAIRNYSDKGYSSKSKQILHIGDNAGETAFGGEQMNEPVTDRVRQTSVVDDTTFDDAVPAGLDEMATIRCAAAGAADTVLSTFNPEFEQMSNTRGIAAADGQGDYEALSNEGRLVFVLLKVKGVIIGDDGGVAEGDVLSKGIDI